MSKKRPTSFALSEEARKALQKIAAHYGLSQSSAMELMLREKLREIEAQQQR